MENQKRAIIMAVNTYDQPFNEDDKAELINLAKACNIEIDGLVLQNLDRVNKDTFVGPGKVEEVLLMANELEVDYIITNSAVSARVIRNFNKLTDQIVLDRNMLILEIFSVRAKSKSAQVQVEIAKINYELPRLVGSSEHLGRQAGSTGGGLANRGLGETKLELERRDLNKKLANLRKDLKILETQQNVQKQQRDKNAIFRVSLVGYTNAGKSTIMNQVLKQSNNENTVFVKDMLFATLDTYTRNIEINGIPNFLLSDTIGFINNLHHTLIEAFKSTLAEVADSDLLLHVIDASNEEHLKHKAITEKTLKEIGADNIPIIEIYNKTDLANYEVIYPNSLSISALNDKDIDSVLEIIKTRMLKNYNKLTLYVPYSDSQILNDLFNSNMTKIIDQDEVAYTVEAYVHADLEKPFKKYLKYLN